MRWAAMIMMMAVGAGAGAAENRALDRRGVGHSTASQPATRSRAIEGCASSSFTSCVADSGSAGGGEMRNVTVCISNNPAVPLTFAAQRMASEIFSAIGVGIEWHDGSCPASPDVIKVSFPGEAPKGVSGGALAYALPYEGTHIAVFYERVKRQCCSPQHLLAYVLVHEITHILQGGAWHSPSGIMKAHWNYKDYYAMRYGSLVFTADDVVSIHSGLDARVARLAGKGPVQVAGR